VSSRRTRLFGRVSDPVIEAERAPDPPAPPVPALTIDALGRKCPIPIIMLAEQIRDVPLGAIVAVLADDPAAYTDIPSWCTMKAHEFAGHQELPQGGWALYIRISWISCAARNGRPTRSPRTQSTPPPRT